MLWANYNTTKYYHGTTYVPYNKNTSRVINYCYDGGTWSIEQTDTTTYHVTIKDYVFDTEEWFFPTKPTDTNGSTFGSYIGAFSAGYIQAIMQFPENVTSVSSLYMKVTIDNIEVTSISEKRITEEQKTTDNVINNQITLYPAGSISKQIYIQNSSGSQLWSAWGAGDSSAGIGQKIRIAGAVYSSQSTDYVLKAVNILQKFDDTAFEIPSGSNESSGSGTYSTQTVLYAAKPDKTGWTDDDEMIATKEEDLIYFSTIDELIENGYTCVGVLFEVRGVTLYARNSVSYYIPVTIKQNSSLVGNTYATVSDARAWIEDIDFSWLDQTYEIDEDYNLKYDEYDYPEYKYSLYTTSYVKTEYDENGQIVSGTHNPGYVYGNSILITGATQSIEITAIDEATGESKINYDMGKSEYEVCYKVTPKVTLNTGDTAVIENVTLSVKITLPEGMTYTIGSGNEEYGEPTVTENDDGTTTLVWYIYGYTAGDEIDDLIFYGHVDEESDNGTQYDVTVMLSEYVSDGDVYKIGNTKASDRTASTSIQIINLSSYSFYKTTETPVIEVNGEVHYKITALNNTDNDVTDFQLLDILPYNGDGRGTSFNGTYTVSQIVITQTNTSTSSEITDNDLNLYVTADESVRSEVTAKDTDLGTTNIWSSTSSGMAIGEELTAYAVTGTLEARERLEIDIYLQTSGNEPYDLYKNSATAQTNAETEVMETSIITVQDVKRSIEGYVWYDENGDGVISDEEEYLSGVTVTLLNSDGTGAIDVSGNTITSTTTDEYGYYEFENMVRGDYIVQFQSATEVKGVNYEFTSKETGSNIEINSKVNSAGVTDTITTLNSVESPEIIENYVNAGIKMTDAEITSTITKTGVVVENEEETTLTTLSLEEDDETNESDTNSDESSNLDNNSNITNESGTENSLTENSTRSANETTTGNTTSDENETTENANAWSVETTTENNTNAQTSETENNETGNVTNKENETENSSTNNNEVNSSETNSSTENNVNGNETNTNSSNSESTTTANETNGQTTSSGASESSFTYSLTTTALEEEEETNTLTKESQSMMYTINYTTKVEDYIGTATVTIVDTLPYELEDGYTYTVTLNGEELEITDVYDSENKTLTWEIPIENIYTYETDDTTVIDGNISIEIILYLKYENIDYEQDSLTNTVTGDIYLEETEQEKQVEDEATTNVDLNLIDIKVTKNWNDDSNSLGVRPSEISITLTAIANGTTYSLDGITTTTITLNSTGGWSYTWEDLPKYDSSGNIINYEITENLSEEQQRIYTVTVEQDTTNSSKLLASYIITNKYTGCTEYEDIIVNKVWQGDTTKTEDGDGNEVEEISSSRPTEVTVVLSANANGESYDITEFTTELEVKLTEIGSWTYTWKNMPKYTETGQEIEYNVQETSTFEEYYLSSITSDTTVDGEITYTVTNSKYGSITLTKVDKTDTSTKLGGATFTLEKLDESGEVDESFTAIPLTTESDTESEDFGTLTFVNLEYGTYKITETKAPEGYNLSTDTLTVTVDSNNVETSITATDKKKTTLPVTGQKGIFYVIIAGIVLLIIGIKTGKIKPAKVDTVRGNTYKPKH